MELHDELVIFLETESTTISALVDAIETGDNEPGDYLNALRQVSSRLKWLSKTLANN